MDNNSSLVKIFEHFKTAQIIAPKGRVNDICFFSELLFRLDSINFNFEENSNFSKLILLDMQMIDFLYTLKAPKKFTIIVLFWNGNFDLEKFKFKFEKAEKELNIDLKYFVIGSFFKKDNKHFNSDDFKNIQINKKFKIYGLDKKKKFQYKYPGLYSLIRIIKCPILAFNKLFYSKIIFMGFGIITPKEVEFYKSDEKKSAYHKYKNDIWSKLSSFSESNDDNIKKCLSLFYNLINQAEFIELKTFQKYSIIQNIFRHTFILICKKFKKFEWIRREGKLFLYHSPFYKNNIFLDFGSKCEPNYFYSRTLFLHKFDKKILHINFFKNMSHNNTDYEKQLENAVHFLENINQKASENKNLNCDKLMIFLENEFKNYYLQK